jgi:DNA-binding CsgD family transcriptional regulator
MRKNAKSGRPAFRPTAAQRRTVSIAAGSGQMSHEEIAIGLGISRNTLEKHFAPELSKVAYQRRLEVIVAMHRSATKGNVAAQKAFVSGMPAVSAPPESGANPEPQGKKDRQNADAVTAAQGTDWDSLIGGKVTPIRKPA